MNLKIPSFELPSKKTVVARSTSLSAWKLPKQSSSIAPEGVWTNSDQDPVPDSKRTWGMWAFTGYWFSDLVTVATWEVGSSILVVGLGTRDAILIMLIAGICNAVPTVLNGAFGADLRVPFPIAIRASYGYYFSYFCVISRAILAAFWLGIQSVGGGAAVTQAITSIWPSYKNLPNHLPSSAGTTTQAMLSYFLYHVIQLPFLFIPMHKMQRMFFFKSLLVPPMAIGILIWICVKAGDANAILNQKATAKGSTHAWLWLASCTSVTGGFSTIAVNMSDFSRFSKTRGSQWTQLPIIPILKIVTALFGIVATGAARVAYGEDIWNPLQLIAKWEDSGGRFLSFVCSCLWILAQISCNISANSVSFANDLTTLFPKWVNITRGTVICSIFGGFALVPWLVVANAYTFLSFMSGYAVFLGPMAGIMMTDYWIVRNRKIDVPGLYDPNGRYYYKLGTNWRALITEFFAVAPLLPGLAYAIAPAHVYVSQGILNLYDINWFFGFPTSAFLYWILNVISPAKTTLVSETIPGILELDGVDVEAVEVQSEATGGNIVGDEKRVADVLVAKGDF